MFYVILQQNGFGATGFLGGRGGSEHSFLLMRADHYLVGSILVSEMSLLSFEVMEDNA